MRSFRCISRVIRRNKITTSCTFSTLPVEPINFNHGISIDKDGNKIHTGFHIDRTNDGPLLLQSMNPHDLDQRIIFNEDSHEYYLDGKLLHNTCTGVINHFFQQFDADTVIEKMITGNNWPRKDYQYPNGDPYKPEDIKRRWNSTRDYAKNYGTWMHYNIERYFNQLKPSDKLAEMSQFYKFEKLWISDPRVTPYRTEWKIVDPEYHLAGTVDFVGRKADGSFVIMDWKRSLKLEQNLTNQFGRKAISPLEHLDDCDGSKYFLQLNLYRSILERVYGMRVSSMVLVSFHSKLEHYLAIEAPNMDYEIERILPTLLDENFRSVIEEEG